MIHANTIDAIWSLSNQLSNSGYMVHAASNSPLAVLGMAINDAYVEKYNKPDTPVVEHVDIVETIIEASKKQNKLGEYIHSDSMDEMVKMAAKAVRAQLQLARNVVKPIIGEVNDEVISAVEEMSITAKRFTVEPRGLPALYGNATLLGFVDRYKNTAQRELPSMQHFPELLPEELEKRCKTGMSRVDEQIKELVGESDMVIQVYNEFFLGRDTGFTENVDYTNAQVIALALSIGLSNNVPDGVDMDLADFRAVLGFAQAEFGRRIFRENERVSRNLRQRRLVTYMPDKNDYGKTIVVDAEVYKLFLKEGGDVDSIIGACLRGVNGASYQGLLEDAYGGKDAVKRHEAMLQSTLKTQREEYVVKAFRKVLSAKISNPEIIREEAVGETRTALTQYLTNIPYRDKDGILDYAKRVVCDVLFPAYNALPVLNGIDEELAANPDLSPREAATLVVIDLVTDYVFDQMIVDKL